MTYEQYEQDGAYRSAAEIIEDLERQLAAVTAERERLTKVCESQVVMIHQGYSAIEKLTAGNVDDSPGTPTARLKYIVHEAVRLGATSSHSSRGPERCLIEFTERALAERDKWKRDAITGRQICAELRRQHEIESATLVERLQRCEQDAEKKDKALNKARDLIDGFNAHPIRIGHCPGCDLIEAIDAALSTEAK